MAAEEVKPRKKKKRRKKHYLLRFLILAALAVGLYFFVRSPFFDVQKIAVDNNLYYTKEQIIELAEAKTGENIFTVDTVSMKEKLLEDPYIKTVKLSKSLPGTVNIFVEERQETAAIPDGALFAIVDRDGMVLRRTETEPMLPIIEGLTVSTMEEGRALLVEERATLTDTLTILDEMQDHDLYFKRIVVSGFIVKAYIYDYLYCQGSTENFKSVIENGSLKAVVSDLYMKETEHGVISIGRDNYISFSPAA